MAKPEPAGWARRDERDDEPVSSINEDATAASPAPAGYPSMTANHDADVVDNWGRQSFPASDPPQNW